MERKVGKIKGGEVVKKGKNRRGPDQAREEIDAPVR